MVKPTVVFLLLVFGVFAFFSPVLAHRSGCHNLHTCSSDTNSYVCGDLGYPCDGSTSITAISASAVFVPLAVEKAFSDIFGRKPTDTESIYWKKRFRDDKSSVYKLRAAMNWHKAKGSFGPKAPVASAAEEMVTNMNAMFESVYGRLPTPSESAYWLSRIKDKPTAAMMIGALSFHQTHNLQH